MKTDKIKPNQFSQSNINQLNLSQNDFNIQFKKSDDFDKNSENYDVFDDANNFTTNIDLSHTQTKHFSNDDPRLFLYNNNTRKRVEQKKKLERKTAFNTNKSFVNPLFPDTQPRKSSQFLLTDKNNQPLFKQQRKTFELEEYFSTQNKEQCSLAYDSFIKMHNAWSHYLLIPSGLCFIYDITKYKSVFSTNNRLKVQNDVLHQYNQNFNSQIKRVINQQNTFNYQIKNHQNIHDFFRNIWSFLVFLFLLWYFAISVSGLRNLNVTGTFWYINLLLIIYRLMALIQFMVFNISQNQISFLIECKEICETQLIMWSDKKIQKQIQHSHIPFIIFTYVIIFINIVPYILTIYSNRPGIFHDKIISDIQGNYRSIKVLSTIINIFATSNIIVTRTYCIWQCYIIFILYKHFFNICVSDFLDNDSQIVDFHNIQNIQAGFGYIVIKINKKLAPVLSASIFFITVFIGIITYCIQKLFIGQFFNPFDWLQLLWWMLISYSFSYLLWIFPQLIHNLNLSLSVLLKNEQHSDTTDEQKTLITQFATTIATHPIAFCALGFELNKDNLRNYYVTTSGYLTAVLFLFKN